VKISWKQIKAEIDGLPKTEKTLALKKMADGFEKELREEYKQLNAEINEYIHTDFEAAKYTRIGKYEKIAELLGDSE
jgi:hypothetical protein